MEVELDISHTARGDLEVSLQSPQGTTVFLHQRKGFAENDLRRTYPKTAIPEGTLDDFRGEAGAGVWTLRVADVFTQDVGTLNRWGIRLREPPTGPTVTVQGRATYQDRAVTTSGLAAPVEKPIRFADVEVFSQSGATYLGSGETDANGNYQISIPQGGTLPILVRVYARQSSTLYKQQVLSDTTTQALYALDSEVTQNTSASFTQNLVADGNSAGVFNIFDVCIDGLDRIREDAETNPPRLTTYWAPNSSDGTYFTTLDDSIHLLGLASDSDDFDDDVILHELGHFAHFKFASNESPGGPHSPQEAHQDPRLAFSEGLANYFSSRVRNDPEQKDISAAGTSRFDLEAPSFPQAARGQDSENTVGAALWDVVDGAQGLGVGTDDDPMNLSDGPLRVFRVIKNRFPQGADTLLERFREGWEEEHGAAFFTTELDQILDSFVVDIRRPNLVRQEGDRALADSAETIVDIPVTATLNLQKVHVFLDLDHPSPEQLQITLESPNGTQVILYQRGNAPGVLPNRANDPGFFDWIQPDEQEPFQPLTGFAGVPSNGTWRLRIRDEVAGVTGTLREVRLDLRGAGSGLPDLEVTALTAPSATTPGAEIQVPFQIRNSGDSAAGAFVTRFYLSTDQTVTSADTFLGVATQTELAAAGEFSGTLTATVPALADGTYFLGALIDADGAVGEGDETNNTRVSPTSTTIAATVTGVDLRIPSISGPATALASGSANLSFEIENGGADASGAFQVGLFLSQDTEITSSDQLLGTTQIADLPGQMSTTRTQVVSIPGTLLSGDYFFGALVDLEATVPETNESNNAGVSPTSVRISSTTSGTDLVALTLTPPAQVNTGASFSVQLEVRNDGEASTGVFSVSVFLGSDLSLDQGNPVEFSRFVLGLLARSSATATPEDLNSRLFQFDEDPNAFNAVLGGEGNLGLLLGTLELASLAPGETRIETLEVSIPTSQPPGEFSVRAVLDPQDQIQEDREDNNSVTSGGLVQVGAPLLADLAPTSLVGPTQVAQGQVFSLTRSLTNLGGLGTGTSFQEEFFLVLGSDVGVSDVSLGSFSESALGAGEGSVRTRTFSLPASVPLTTTARFAVRVDTQGNVAEAEENNNTFVSTQFVQVLAATNLPDLIATQASLNIGAEVLPGQQVEFRSRIENRGLASALVPTRTRLQLYPEPRSDVSPTTVLAEIESSTLAAGGVQNQSTAITWPTSIPGGEYFLGVEVDFTQAVSELSESNNRFVSTAPLVISTALQGIDLVVSSVEEPFVASPGEPMFFDTLIVNRGNTAISTPFFQEFYLSRDAILDAGDFALSPRIQLPGLAAFGQSLLQTSLVLPTSDVTGPGPFFLIARADVTSVVPELFEDNNVTTSGGSFPIRSPVAELRATDFQVQPFRIARGGRVQSEAFFRNVGTLATPASFQVSYSLSEDSSDPSADRFSLGSFSETRLVPGEARVRSQALDIPSTIDPGTYDICFDVDGANTVPEAGTAINGFCRLGFQVTDVSQPPDYVTTEVEAPFAIFQNHSLVVRRRVENRGQTGTTTSSTLSYYLSTSTQITSDSVLLGSEILPGLGSGGNNEGAVRVRIPGTTVPGNYQIVAFADALDEIGDVVRSNNQDSLDHLLEVRAAPDVIASQVTHDSNVRAGSNLIVTRQITNQGGGRAIGPFVNRYYLSLDETFDDGDFLLGVDSSPSLLATEVDLASPLFRVPSSLAPGTYRLGVEVDVTDLTLESIEENNLTTSPIPLLVIGAPDLFAESFTYSTTGVPSTPLEAEVRIRNLGNLPVSSPFLVEFFLSDEGIPDPADPSLGTTLVNTVLSPYEVLDLSLRLSLPAVTPGDYFPYVEVDATGLIAEVDESLASNTRVAATSFPLVAPDAQAPQPRITVRNLSTGLIEASEVLGAGTYRVEVDFQEPVSGPPQLTIEANQGSSLGPSPMSQGTTTRERWFYTWTIPVSDGLSFFDGDRTFRVQGARDDSGNQNLPLDPGESFRRVDTTPPSILEPLSPPDQSTHPVGGFTVFGTTADQSQVVVQISQDGSVFQTVVATAPPGVFSFSRPSTQDITSFRLLVRDQAGNETVTASRSLFLDSDSDALPDAYERAQSGGLTTLSATGDADRDGLSDRDEFLRGTLPLNADTDGDGISDGDEVAQGTDPIHGSNRVPVAQVGAGSSGPPRLVRLDGSSSFDPDGDRLSFAWTQVSGPETVALDTQVGPVVQGIFRRAGTYLHQLVVRDGKVASAPVLVSTTVQALAPNSRPWAPQVISAAAETSLDGSRAQDPNGDEVNHNWSEAASNPRRGILLDLNLARARLLPPGIGFEGAYLFTDLTDDGQQSTARAPQLELVVVSDGRTPPSADPGPDLRTSAGVAIDLIGSGTRDPETARAGLSFQWSLDPGNPPGASLAFPGPLGPDRPRFLASNPGVYRVHLQVGDGVSLSPPRTVEVLVDPFTRIPEARALGPTSVSLGSSVVLDGSTSVARQGLGLGYAWEQTQGVPVQLENALTAAPSFLPVLAGDYTFHLRVSEAGVISDEDEIRVRVLSPGNAAPRASATFQTLGSPLSALRRPQAGQPLALDGRASVDDGGNLEYRWRQLQGPWVLLENPQSSTPTLRPPSGAYAFELTVSDGTHADTATVRFTVDGTNQPPEVVLQDPAPAAVGATATLSALGTIDPDGASLEFFWTQTRGPAVSFSGQGSPVIQFVPGAEAEFQFEVRVFDGVDLTPPQTLTFLTQGLSTETPTATPTPTLPEVPGPGVEDGGGGGGCRALAGPRSPRPWTWVFFLLAVYGRVRVRPSRKRAG